MRSLTKPVRIFVKAESRRTARTRPPGEAPISRASRFAIAATFIVCGGDGTVNEAVNGLALEQVPCGTSRGNGQRPGERVFRFPGSPRAAKLLITSHIGRIALVATPRKIQRAALVYFLSVRARADAISGCRCPAELNFTQGSWLTAGGLPPAYEPTTFSFPYVIAGNGDRWLSVISAAQKNTGTIKDHHRADLHIRSSNSRS